MDSAVVSKSIKRLVRPKLQHSGFHIFSTRSAWRHSNDRVDVVNFRAVGPYFGAVTGCTPFSFTINLGCHLRGIPEMGKVKKKDDLAIPEEFQCFFRRQLRKTSKQPGLSRAPDRSDVWFVDPQGNNLNALVEEATAVIQRDGLPWFKELPGLDGALSILLDQHPAPKGTWGQWGKNSSAARHCWIGYVALALGKHDLAAEHLQQAIDKGVYKSTKEMDAALRQAREQM